MAAIFEDLCNKDAQLPILFFNANRLTIKLQPRFSIPKKGFISDSRN